MTTYENLITDLNKVRSTHLYPSKLINSLKLINKMRINQRFQILIEVNEDGSNYLMLAMKLVEDLALLRKFLKRISKMGASYRFQILNQIDKDGRNYFMLAMRNQKDLKVLRQCLGLLDSLSAEQRLSILNQKDKNGWSGLHLAMNYIKDPALLRQLLVLLDGLNVEQRLRVLTQTNIEGYNFLMLAMRNQEDPKVLRQCLGLLDSLSAEERLSILTQKDKDGWSGLHLAMNYVKDPALLRQLLVLLDGLNVEQRLRVLTQTNIEGYNFLMLAMKHVKDPALLNQLLGLLDGLNGEQKLKILNQRASSGYNILNIIDTHQKDTHALSAYENILKASKAQIIEDKMTKFLTSVKKNDDKELKISSQNEAVILLLTQRHLSAQRQIEEMAANMHLNESISASLRDIYKHDMLLISKLIQADSLTEGDERRKELLKEYLTSHEKLLDYRSSMVDRGGEWKTLINDFFKSRNDLITYEEGNLKKDKRLNEIFEKVEGKTDIKINELRRYGFSKKQLQKIGVLPKTKVEETRKSDTTAKNQELIQVQIIFNHKRFLLEECLTANLDRNQNSVSSNRYKADNDSSKYLLDLKYIYDYAVTAYERQLASQAIHRLVYGTDLASQHKWVGNIERGTGTDKTAKEKFARAILGNPIINAVASLSRGEKTMQDLQDSMLDEDFSTLQRFLTKGPTKPSIESQKRVIASTTDEGKGVESDIDQLSDIEIAQLLCENTYIIDDLVAERQKKGFSVKTDYINKYLQLVISGGDDPLTRGFEKNGFPQFYHCTKKKEDFNNIARLGYIYLPGTPENPTKTRSYFGAYVSTQMEVNYGKYGFAIAQPIKNFPVYNSNSEGNTTWLGFAKRIDLAEVSFVYQPDCPDDENIERQNISGREVPVFGFNEVFILKEAVAIAKKVLSNIDTTGFEVDQRYWVDLHQEEQRINKHNYRLFKSLPLKSQFNTLAAMSKEDLLMALGFGEDQSKLRPYTKVSSTQKDLLKYVYDIADLKSAIDKHELDEIARILISFNHEMISAVISTKLIDDGDMIKILKKFISEATTYGQIYTFYHVVKGFSSQELRDCFLNKLDVNIRENESGTTDFSVLKFLIDTIYDNNKNVPGDNILSAVVIHALSNILESDLREEIKFNFIIEYLKRNINEASNDILEKIGALLCQQIGSRKLEDLYCEKVIYECPEHISYLLNSNKLNLAFKKKLIRHYTNRTNMHNTLSIIKDFSFNTEDKPAMAKFFLEKESRMFILSKDFNVARVLYDRDKRLPNFWANVIRSPDQIRVFKFLAVVPFILTAIGSVFNRVFFTKRYSVYSRVRDNLLDAGSIFCEEKTSKHLADFTTIVEVLNESNCLTEQVKTDIKKIIGMNFIEQLISDDSCLRQYLDHRESPSTESITSQSLISDLGEVVEEERVKGLTRDTTIEERDHFNYK